MKTAHEELKNWKEWYYGKDETAQLISRAIAEHEALQAQYMVDHADAKQFKAKLTALTHQADELWRENLTHREAAKNNYWAWQGDGHDHLDSLTCPVAIQPVQLAEILSKLTAYEKQWTDMHETIGQLRAEHEATCKELEIRSATCSTALQKAEELKAALDASEAKARSHEEELVQGHELRRQLTAKLDASERRGAQKHEAIAELVSTWNEAHGVQKLLIYERGMRMASEALASDCGKGWASPEQVGVLREALEHYAKFHEGSPKLQQALDLCKKLEEK